MATEEGWDGIAEVTALVYRRSEQLRQVSLTSDDISNLTATITVSGKTRILEINRCLCFHKRVFVGPETR